VVAVKELAEETNACGPGATKDEDLGRGHVWTGGDGVMLGVYDKIPKFG
jgi:hypothetical protein